MAEDKGIAEGESKESSPPPIKQKGKGVLSCIWNAIFRIKGDDFEKRLQHISKEEAAVLSRMKRRSLTWRRMIRHLIIFSVILEVPTLYPSHNTLPFVCHTLVVIVVLKVENHFSMDCSFVILFNLKCLYSLLLFGKAHGRYNW